MEDPYTSRHMIHFEEKRKKRRGKNNITVLWYPYSCNCVVYNPIASLTLRPKPIV